MPRLTHSPPQPSTPAQRARYDRIIRTATQMLKSGGEDALQMKDLVQQAGISLDTLYRYFPSKEHVIAAIEIDRYERAYSRIVSDPPRGGTVRGRVTDYLLYEFTMGQRNPWLTAALFRARHGTSRRNGDILERLYRRHQEILRIAAGDEAADHQLRLLPVVAQVYGSAITGWLAGIFSEEQVRFEIRAGCRLLDLSADIVNEDIEGSGGKD